jgi:hypothetical protein
LGAAGEEANYVPLLLIHLANQRGELVAVNAFADGAGWRSARAMALPKIDESVKFTLQCR